MCIDDFALKKREKYGTVMVDIDTHKIIDMIESRDQATVAEWLKSYPNIEVIARDGSVTYHNAICEAHPKAVQVSDRFHLFKNLTDYVIEYLKKHLKAVIELVVDNTETSVPNTQVLSKDNENRKLTQEEKYQRILLLQLENKTQTEICRSVNMDVRCYKKLMSATDEERQEMFRTIAVTTHEDKVMNKMKIAGEVRNLNIKGLSKRAISMQTGLSSRTITKYLDSDFNPVHASYGKKKIGILSDFYNEINELLEQGIMGSKIESIIRNKGYNGSSSTIRHYVSEWKKRYKIDVGQTKVGIEDGKKHLSVSVNNILSLLQCMS